MSNQAAIIASLEQLAEAGMDITPAVYRAFFAHCPTAQTLFASQEARAVQGKMVNELVQTVLDRLDGKPYSATLVATMVSDHNSWGVTLPMYDAFLVAFAEALADALGAGANPALMPAWRDELGSLREQIAAQLT